MNIKRAKIDDLDRIMEIEEKSFTEKESTSRDNYIYRINNYNHWFFVAEEDEEVLGFITCRPTKGTSMKDKFFEANKIPESGVLAILAIAIASEYQNRHIATRLIQHIIRLSKERRIHSVILACEEEMIPFFQAFGFEKGELMQSSITTSPRYNMLLHLGKK